MPPPAYRAIADAVHELGVTDVFGVLGEDLAVFLAGLLTDPTIVYHAARQESAAVCMAQGYARATGRLGVCVVSKGPGLTNALTGLVQARKANAPLLVLVGGAPRDAVEPTSGVSLAKHVRQPALAAAAGIDLAFLDEASTAAQTIIEAADRARRGCPVIVQISVDLEQDVTDLERPPVLARAATTAPDSDDRAPSADAIDHAARLLAAARRPLIVGGRGAHAAGARDTLIALARRSGALLGTSVLGMGLFEGEAQSIGLVGGFSHGPGREVVEQADCVLAFGASLNLFTVGMGRLFTNADVCQFALDPEPTGLATAPAIVADCDARRAAQLLLAALDEHQAPVAQWPGELINAVRDYRPAAQLSDRSGARGADPETLLCALDEALPADRNVVLDGGHFTGFATMYLTVPSPDRFFYGLDFAAVGVGHPTGIGVAIARPDELTVIVVGDGGLLMTLGELDVVRAENLRVVIVVMNDAAYGAEVHFLNLRDLPGDVAALPAQDFAGIASAMGIEALTVRTPEEAAAAVAGVEARSGPLLLDCRIDPMIRAAWLEELYR